MKAPTVGVTRLDNSGVNHRAITEYGCKYGRGPRGNFEARSGAPKFLGKRFRGSATKFPAYGSPVFASDIDPTPCFSRDIAAQSVWLATRHVNRAHGVALAQHWHREQASETDCSADLPHMFSYRRLFNVGRASPSASVAMDPSLCVAGEPEMSSVPGKLELVGRDRTLAELRGYFGRILTGQRQVVFVTGEPWSRWRSLI